MRVNVYTEEIIDSRDKGPFVEIISREYVSSRTGMKMTNYGLRLFFKSPPELHFSENDDDRSAVTLWFGSDKHKIYRYVEMLMTFCIMNDAELS